MKISKLWTNTCLEGDKNAEEMQYYKKVNAFKEIIKLWSKTYLKVDKKCAAETQKFVWKSLSCEIELM